MEQGSLNLSKSPGNHWKVFIKGVSHTSQHRLCQLAIGAVIFAFSAMEFSTINWNHQVIEVLKI